jgi:urocanate hydratase
MNIRKSEQAKAIMLMIQNNLDYAAAQHPHELITYAGNGVSISKLGHSIFDNAVLLKRLVDKTLTMYSGHPVIALP